MVKPRLSPHHHSGRYLPHKHTSYAALAFVTMLVSVLLLAVTQATLAVQNPQGSSVALSATVSGPAPTQAAVILVPQTGQHFTNSLITISGTCGAGLVIEIFSNNIFVGSTLCDESGKFSLQANLLPGQNDLLAKSYDSLDQAAPDSKVVTVFNDSKPVVSQGTATGPGTAAPFILQSKGVYRGIFPGDSLQLELTVEGGKAPYALEINWGDGTVDVRTVQFSGPAQPSHVYKTAGTHTIIIRGSDAQGAEAYLQTIAVVNGPVNGQTKKELPGNLLVAWPLLLVALLLILSFWLGERYDRWRENRRGGKSQPQPA